MAVTDKDHDCRCDIDVVAVTDKDHDCRCDIDVVAVTDKDLHHHRFVIDTLTKRGHKVFLLQGKV